MAKKILVLGITFMMCLGLFAGCGNSGLWFKSSYNDDGFFGKKMNDNGYINFTSALVNSVSEMRGLCQEWDNAAYQESNALYSNELNKKIREYGDDFFLDKAIIIMQFSGGNAGNGCTHSIKSLRIENDILIVNRQSTRKKGTWNDYAVFRVFIVEVNKADIHDVTELRIEI